MLKSDAPESVTACEAKLRQQMLDHSIRFTTVNSLDSIVSASNVVAAKAKNPEYKVSMMKGAVSAISIDFKTRSPEYVRTLTYNLSSNDSSSDSPMTLRLTQSEIRNPGQHGSYSEFAQSFTVSKNCETSLSKTDIQTMGISKTTSEGLTVTADSKSVFYNGEVKSDSKSQFVPNNLELTNFIDTTDDELPTPNQRSFLPSMGLIKAVLKGTSAKKVEDFGTMQLDTKEFEIQDAGGKVLVELEYAKIGNKESGLLDFSRSLGTNNWTISLDRWNSVHLSSGGLKVATSKLSLEYLTKQNSFIVENSKSLSYDHLNAYFDTNETTSRSSEGKNRFLMTERYPPTMAGTVTPADLVSNDTIQTELPKIQEIKKSILTQAPHDRYKQIELILTYLGENYVYDHSMVNNNVVRALSTQEALDRGTGVCQHYAVIFTAIARSLKIPSRIVSGYALSVNPPGFHAWVEAEVRPGVWQVIEPQSAKGLTETLTRFYFPLERATDLEDKNTFSLGFYKTVLENELSFLPAN